MVNDETVSVVDTDIKVGRVARIIENGIITAEDRTQIVAKLSDSSVEEVDVRVDCSSASAKAVYLDRLSRKKSRSTPNSWSPLHPLLNRSDCRYLIWAMSCSTMFSISVDFLAMSSRVLSQLRDPIRAVIGDHVLRRQRGESTDVPSNLWTFISRLAVVVQVVGILALLLPGQPPEACLQVVDIVDAQVVEGDVEGRPTNDPRRPIMMKLYVRSLHTSNLHRPDSGDLHLKDSARGAD